MTEVLDSQGKPARAKNNGRCPSCAAPKERRVKSGGFGEPHPVCGECGHEFHDEKWGDE